MFNRSMYFNNLPFAFVKKVLNRSLSKMGEPTALTVLETKKLCSEPDPSTKEFIMQQTMYRIRDPKLSIPFYTNVLGMRLLQKLDFAEMKFSLYFMGYEDSSNLKGDLGSNERTEWTFGQKATIELTHNWGTELETTNVYHNGNSDPRGFGHIGVMVPDVEKACQRFEQLGVEFVKRPHDGKMKGIAFIKDPDGYWIEIFNNKVVANITKNC